MTAPNYAASRLDGPGYFTFTCEGNPVPYADSLLRTFVNLGTEVYGAGWEVRHVTTGRVLVCGRIPYPNDSAELGARP